MKVCIVLPTYNEKECIEPLLKSILTISGRLSGFDTHILVVDDNSPDGTWVIVKKLMVKTKKLKLIRRMKERGLPSAISEGIKNAKKVAEILKEKTTAPGFEKGYIMDGWGRTTVDLEYFDPGYDKVFFINILFNIRQLP